jgi:hypothetical protein
VGVRGGGVLGKVRFERERGFWEGFGGQRWMSMW